VTAIVFVPSERKAEAVPAITNLKCNVLVADIQTSCIPVVTAPPALIENEAV